MKRAGENNGDHVAELQGLYGPYAFSEKLLQKIWLLGLFETRSARLADGRPLEVLSPGGWNLLGGPDFRGALLRIDGVELTGDVEVHFRAADWSRHGHDNDPAYDEVVLHVVLFEPQANAPAPLTRAGRAIAQFVLLPWLHCNLEEFAADEAVERLAQRDAVRLAELLLELDPPQRRAQLRAGAAKRWRQKVHYAGVRLARLGWEEACHHTALEILGYRFNRAAMLAVAERFPLAAWRRGLAEAEALAAGVGLWRHQGVRPANAPRRRLAQYRAWVAARPEWPDRWRSFSDDPKLVVPDSALADVTAARREYDAALLLERIDHEVVGGAVGGARLATLVENGLLPLLAAQTGKDLFARWYCGPPGDAPEMLFRALRMAGVFARANAPRHEGPVQGLLQWVFETPAGWGGSGCSGGVDTGEKHR